MPVCGASGSVERADRRSAFGAGFSRVTIHGRIAVYQPLVVASVPFLPGASRAAQGRLLQVLEIDESAGTTSLRLSVSTVHRDPDVTFEQAIAFPLADLTRYLLFDAARREAIALQSRGSTQGGTGLVMAGPGSLREITRLNTSVAFPDPDTTMHEPWSGRSNLLLIDWQPVGSYDVSASFTPEPASGTAR